MKTEVVSERVAFSVSGWSYNGDGITQNVSFEELRHAGVGSIWNGFDTNNCGRDLHEESAEVIHRTDKGVAVLFRVWGTTDEPNPVDWEDEPILRWYEFA